MPNRNFQVGGQHYVKKRIQPWDIMKEYLTPEQFQGFLHGNAIKYILRDKGNKVEDLQKAIHYIEKLLSELGHESAET